MITNTQQSGVGIIEVIVSLLLLALGVLGFSALQVRSLQVTAQSSAYTESLSIMRDLSERIRGNPAALAKYKEKVNATSVTKPSNSCGVFESSATSIPVCSPNDMAVADVYSIKQRYKTTNKSVSRIDMEMKIVSCPGTPSTGENQTSCIIAAWNGTKPQAGGNKDDDCVDSSTGKYHPNSNCLIMEVF